MNNDSVVLYKIEINQENLCELQSEISDYFDTNFPDYSDCVFCSILDTWNIFSLYDYICLQIENGFTLLSPKSGNLTEDNIAFSIMYLFKTSNLNVYCINDFLETKNFKILAKWLIDNNIIIPVAEHKYEEITKTESLKILLNNYDDNWHKIKIDYQKFEKDIKLLGHKIKQQIVEDHIEYKKIFPIPRGGLIIAVYLSHFLNIEIETDLSKIHPINKKYILIVDDLVDTGKTLEQYSEYDLAVLYHKPRSIIVPKYFVETFNNNKWLQFPYELESEIPNREV